MRALTPPVPDHVGRSQATSASVATELAIDLPARRPKGPRGRRGFRSARGERPRFARTTLRLIHSGTRPQHDEVVLFDRRSGWLE